MSLPSDVARCPGKRRVTQPGEWPFPTQMDECVNCARRIAGLSAYLHSEDVQWMTPPAAEPCAEKLEPKK